MPDLIVKKRWALGMIDLETHHTEAELLELAGRGAKGPNHWDLSAMAVAIAAAREIEQLKAAVQELAAITGGDTRELKAAVQELAASAALGLPVGRPSALRAQDIPSGASVGGIGLLYEQLESESESESEIEPDSDELQADYERRLARVERHAVSGIGWSELVRRALGPRRGTYSHPRPTPRELAKMEQWIDQNATRKPGGAL